MDSKTAGELIKLAKRVDALERDKGDKPESLLADILKKINAIDVRIKAIEEKGESRGERDRPLEEITELRHFVVKSIDELKKKKTRGKK